MIWRVGISKVGGYSSRSFPVICRSIFIVPGGDPLFRACRRMHRVNGGLILLLMGMLGITGYELTQNGFKFTKHRVSYGSSR